MTVVALSGGIGGAKLALGLKRVLLPGSLTVIANTGDDFVHIGLNVSPDIDTLVYALAGLDNPETGWGRRDETWSFMAAIGELGGETWFQLGDRDLAMHVTRSQRLAGGDTLTSITADACRALGVGARILPMSDRPVATKVTTAEGDVLDFQDYFVRRRSEPVVEKLIYAGAGEAQPAEGVVEAIRADDTRAIVICPSNPLISIEPILAVPGIEAAIRDARAPVIAVSPIIAGKAVKGPTAKMLAELGFEPTAETVLKRYQHLLDGFLADPRDMNALEAVCGDVRLFGADIMMSTLDDRERVARSVLAAAEQLK